MEKHIILDFKSSDYSSSNMAAASVTGGGGCACDDGTSE